MCGWFYKDHAGRASNEATTWLENPRPSEGSQTQ